MDYLILEIESALKNNEYFIALFCTLTLPDICAALESEDGETTGQRYRDWYSNNMVDQRSLDDKQCYNFRCKMLHQGRSSYHNTHSKDGKNDKDQRVIFIYPNDRIYMDNNRLFIGTKEAITVDLRKFCKNMIQSVRIWESKMKKNPIYIKNCENLITIRPDGIAPFVVGMPFIG